jgi:hypothetical protein
VPSNQVVSFIIIYQVLFFNKLLKDSWEHKKIMTTKLPKDGFFLSLHKTESRLKICGSGATIITKFARR